MANVNNAIPGIVSQTRLLAKRKRLAKHSLESAPIPLQNQNDLKDALRYILEYLEIDYEEAIEQ